MSGFEDSFLHFGTNTVMSLCPRAWNHLTQIRIPLQEKTSLLPWLMATLLPSMTTGSSSFSVSGREETPARWERPPPLGPDAAAAALPEEGRRSRPSASEARRESNAPSSATWSSEGSDAEEATGAPELPAAAAGLEFCSRMSSSRSWFSPAAWPSLSSALCSSPSE